MRDTVFSPALGNLPSQLVGRDSVISALLAGLDSNPGNKERATLLLGQGDRKTVLLWELAEQARQGSGRRDAHRHQRERAYPYRGEDSG